MTLALLIRPSTAADLAAITAIYGWNVLHGTGTFELDAARRGRDGAPPRRRAGQGPALAGGRARRRRCWATPTPTTSGRAGPTASASRTRSTCADDARGQGLGRLLLAELLARCEAAGARQMLAVIGDSANAGSIGVHRALGFEHVGVLQAAGWKFDRWLDVVLMQKRARRRATPPHAGGPRMTQPAPLQSKTLATWIALLGGSLGLHRFYLHGLRDRWGWLHPLPTLLGPVRRAAHARARPGRPPRLGC